MISLPLLIHTVNIKRITGHDFNGEPTYTTNTVDRVRVGLKKGMRISAVGFESGDVMALYIDCINSVGVKEISNGDIVEFDGKEYEARNVRVAYTQGTDTPHHIKAELV